MKKKFLILIFLPTVGFGQDVFDALELSGRDLISGSAREAALAGATGALGGMPASFITNPAGVGIYRSSEISLSADNNSFYNTANWNGEKRASFSNKFSLGNVSLVNAKLIGGSTLTASNFGFAYNRTRRFQNRAVFTTASAPTASALIADQCGGLSATDFSFPDAFEDAGIGWFSALGVGSGLVQELGEGIWQSAVPTNVAARYEIAASGYADEFSAVYAANFQDVFYFGASVSVEHLNYTKTSVLRETFPTGEWALENSLIYSGFALKCRLGAILRPLWWLRLGLATCLPSRINLSQYSQPKIFSSLGEKSISLAPNIVEADQYNLYTPANILASAGFLISDKAAIDLDYEVKFLNLMRYYESGFGEKNAEIKNFARPQHILRLGGEYKPAPFFAVRLGAFGASAQIRENAQRLLPENSLRTDPEAFRPYITWGASLGVGFRRSVWGIDLAYIFTEQNGDFSYTPSAARASEIQQSHRVLLTGSWRF